MSALFGSGSSTTRSKNLIEFKAGKMILQGKTVKPDKRKGLIYVCQSDDSLMHFCWKDRTSGTVEDDLIIFPDDIEYKKVTQCTTGRVFLLRLKNSNKKMFFWMQDPDSEKDDKNWRKLNDYLNNPPAPGSMGGGGGGSSSAERSASALSSAFGGDLSGSDLQSLLSSMNEQQIQQLLGLSGIMPVNSPTSASNVSTSQNSRAPSATPARAAVPTTTQNEPSTPVTTTSTTAGESKPTTQTSSANQRIQLSDLQNILGNLNTSSTPAYVDLAEMLSVDVMAPILTNKEVQEKLIQYLPEGDCLPKNELELRNTFSTPQFKRAMHSFSEALQSGQLGPLLQQFNLPTDVLSAAASGNIEEFAKAMQDHMKNTKTAKSSNKSNDEDEKMDT